VPYLGITVFSIGSQLAAIVVLADALGMPEITFAKSMVVLGVVALGLVLPNAPGFFGTMQLTLYAGLATYVAPAKVAFQGAALVFVFYVTYLATIVACALVAVLAELAP
jgi:hypothetical protein